MSIVGDADVPATVTNAAPFRVKSRCEAESHGDERMKTLSIAVEPLADLRPRLDHWPEIMSIFLSAGSVNAEPRSAISPHTSAWWGAVVIYFSRAFSPGCRPQVPFDIDG